MSSLAILRPSEVTSATQRWLEDRFSRSLLILGDLTAPLAGLTTIFVACTAGGIAGVAARFEGFARVVVSIAADDDGAALALHDAASPGLLAVSAGDRAASLLGGPVHSEDFWMTRRTDGAERRGPAVPADDREALHEFYRREGVDFWTPAMFAFGHHFVVHDGDGRVAAAAGVNFIVSDYAQLGAVATAGHARGRDYATSCLSAVIASLHAAGVRECGLFADEHDERLLRLYSRLGFEPRGRFRFIG